MGVSPRKTERVWQVWIRGDEYGEALTQESLVHVCVCDERVGSDFPKKS